MTYKEALDYINNRDWFGSRLGLERVEELLRRLGDPQKRLKFVHVAGTNGKGSCSAMIASVMKAAGYKTGLYTSPYIYRFNERMQINGKEIDDGVLAELVTELQPVADAMEEHPLVFEMVTAAAMLWFAREKCDIVVLEVGLGGRLDATNVIGRPEAAVIMNIGLDHTEQLGNTVAEIAREKAGIIKEDGRVVLYQQNEEAENVIRSVCEEKRAELTVTDFSAIEPAFDSLEGQTFLYKGEEYAIPLLGAHQRRNAAAAIETVRMLQKHGWEIEQGDLEHGLYSVYWPARFEILAEEPWFVLDGGHNPQCAGTVVENLANYFPGARHILLTGVLKDKDYRTMFSILNLAADEYICVTPENPRALPAAELAEYLKKFGKPVTVCESVEDGVFAALDRARTGAEEAAEDPAAAETGIAEDAESTERSEFAELPDSSGAMVCAVGSLYMAGKIRECLGMY